MARPNSASANLAGGQVIFVCHYCPKEFKSARARGSHLKAHTNPRKQQAPNRVRRGHVRGRQNGQVVVGAQPSHQRAAPPVSNGTRGRRSAPGNGQQQIPHQQQLNASQHLPMVVSQPPPQQQPLPLPEASSNRGLITVSQQLQDVENSTPVVLVRCCCGITEKIPQTMHELMERANYEGGCFTLDYRHQHNAIQCQPQIPLPPVEIPFLDLAPPAEVEATAEENSAVVHLESGPEIDLSLGL
ncbi:hypothetical protein ACP70R_018895 [Stipagrostis hirtigluma subsp. patula]